MNLSCSNTGCPINLSSECVFYEGAAIPDVNINTNDDLQTVIQKLAEAIEGGGGGGAVWGAITGTLTDQTDLINYLSAVYLTGAAAASIYTPLSRNITINGITQDLSIDRIWNVGVVTSISGTANRISISGTSQVPIIDIASTYIGQNSITTLGTIGTGVWQGTVIGSNYGGAGSINGILKANGSGVVSQAVSNVDYLIPSDAWLSASGAALTANNTISGAFNIGFTNTAIGVGLAPGSITANTKFEIRGDGTSSATGTQRWADSGNTKLLELLDDGGLRFGDAVSRPSIFPSNGGTTIVKAGTALTLLVNTTSASGGILLHNVNAINPNIVTLSTPLVASSGTVGHTVLRLLPSYNFTGTHSGGTLTGIQYSPTLTNMVGVDIHLAFYSTAGSIFLASTALNTVTATTKVDIRAIGDNNGTTNLILRAANLSNVDKFRLQENGRLVLGGTSTNSTYLDVTNIANLTNIVAFKNNAGNARWTLTENGNLTHTVSGGPSFSIDGTSLIVSKTHTGATSDAFVIHTLGLTSTVATGETIVNTRLNGVMATSGAFVGTYIGLDYNPSGTLTFAGLTNIAFRATSGSVLIGGTTLTNSAILDLQSTTMAFIPPRMTTTQRDNIVSPSAGMVVYNTTTNKLNVYTTAWEAVTSV